MQALEAELKGSGYFDSVLAWANTDVAEALEALRVSEDRTVLLVHGEDGFEHQLEDDIPVRCIWTASMDLILVDRTPGRDADAAPSPLIQVKDDLLDRLTWSDIGIAGLLCLPKTAVPFQMMDGDKTGRSAWQVTLEFRLTINP